MGVLVLAVPALLVVVVGYVVGYAAWGWLTDAADAVLGTSLGRTSPEPAGWLTGLVLLVVVVRLLLRWYRRWAAPGR